MTFHFRTSFSIYTVGITSNWRSRDIRYKLYNSSVIFPLVFTPIINVYPKSLYESVWLLIDYTIIGKIFNYCEYQILKWNSQRYHFILIGNTISYLMYTVTKMRLPSNSHFKITCSNNAWSICRYTNNYTLRSVRIIKLVTIQ